MICWTLGITEHHNAVDNVLALISLALPLLALLTACNMGAGGNASSGESEQGNLVGARIGAHFTLTDQDGKTVHWDDYKGQYRIVYFGYTFCPDVCPADLMAITQALDALAGPVVAACEVGQLRRDLHQGPQHEGALTQARMGQRQARRVQRQMAVEGQMDAIKTQREYEALDKEIRDATGSLRKLIIFSEHRDTLSYLADRIRTLLGKEEAVVTIHGANFRLYNPNPWSSRAFNTGDGFPRYSAAPITTITSAACASSARQSDRSRRAVSVAIFRVRSSVESVSAMAQSSRDAASIAKAVSISVRSVRAWRNTASNLGASRNAASAAGSEPGSVGPPTRGRHAWNAGSSGSRTSTASPARSAVSAA